MFSYVAYGLGIRSTLPLPELVVDEVAADVTIRLGTVDRSLSKASVTGSCLWATAQEACFFWAEVGTFLVRGGCEIVIDPAPGVEEQVVRLFLLGSALGVLLYQRGLLVLHANAVSVDGGAVAFLGGPGWGKSTVAAAFYARGGGIVADDVTAVRVEGGIPTVVPGFPQLKLWPEVAVFLGDDVETLPRLRPQLEKRARRVTDRFSPDCLPLRRIYVLSEGMPHKIEPLRPGEALVELLRHSYAVRLLEITGTASAHFVQCAHLANRVPVCRLRRQRSLAALPDLARLVEEDLARTLG